MENLRQRRTIGIISDRPAFAEQVAPIVEASGALAVEPVSLNQSLDSLLALSGQADLGAVILDAATGDEPAAGHDVGSIAAALRAVRPELPIALFVDATPHAPIADEGVFDLVIDGERVEQRWPIYEARLLRSMGRYEDAMDDKLRRIRDLVDHLGDNDLAPAREHELATLQAEIERPFATTNAVVARAWNTRLDAGDQRLAKLQETVDRLNADVSRLLHQ